MPLYTIEDDDASRIVELRVMPRQRIPVLNPETLEAIGWLGNISLSGLMIRSSESFAYRRLHEVRFELGLGELIAIDAGIQLIWSKSAPDAEVSSGFAIRRIAAPTRARLRAWIEQHRHEHMHRTNQLPCLADAHWAA